MSQDVEPGSTEPDPDTEPADEPPPLVEDEPSQDDTEPFVQGG